ncbi:hypothetical protein EG329_006140 [Mollisiaceae sp. DMI_Dod_QoI]|nr:hypothetical protein EG329_006140 [Helotiales sp. DMI_Dod_QoI]
MSGRAAWSDDSDDDLSDPNWTPPVPRGGPDGKFLPHRRMGYMKPKPTSKRPTPARKSQKKTAKAHLGTTVKRQEGIPDMIRAVQRTPAFIPESVFKVEESFQRRLVDMHGYNYAPKNRILGSDWKNLLSSDELSDFEEGKGSDEKVRGIEKERYEVRNRDIIERALGKLPVSVGGAGDKDKGDGESGVGMEEKKKDCIPWQSKSKAGREKQAEGEREEEEETEERIEKTRSEPIVKEKKLEYIPIKTGVKVNKMKKQERIREFHCATDEELKMAAEECEALIQQSAEEERPKKEKIWKEVYEQAKKNNIQNDGPYKTYLPREWPEKKYIREYLRRRLASINVEDTPLEELSMKCLVEVNHPEDLEPAIPDRLITDSIHIKDCDGETLFVKINTGAEEVFEGRRHPQIRHHILEAMDRLVKRGVTAPTPSKDVRHPSKYFRIAKDYWTKRGKPCGVYLFALWCAQGHAHDPWALSGPWNHSLSNDVVGKKMDIGFRFRFLADMAPIQQMMSLWFEVIDPVRYKIFKGHVDMMCDDDTGMDAIRYTQNQSFLGIASLRNVQVHNHKDKGDVRDGWIGMTCVGAFTDGELCLPDLNLKVRFLPGDLIFFRIAVLQHFIRATVGERSSVLFFSHSGPRNISQNARYMSEDDERYQAAIDSKLDNFQKRQDKEDRIRAHADLPPYPTIESDLTESKLVKASRRKKRFVKHAKEEFKRGHLASEDLERVENTPAAAFYQLNLVELARHAKG